MLSGIPLGQARAPSSATVEIDRNRLYQNWPGHYVAISARDPLATHRFPGLQEQKNSISGKPFALSGH